MPEGGEYTVGYRVVSEDGHPVSGVIRFFVAGVPGAPPPAAPEPFTTHHCCVVPHVVGTTRLGHREVRHHRRDSGSRPWRRDCVLAVPATSTQPQPPR